MNKSINTFLADQNVIQSLEQQFDYLFKCAGVTLMSCWDLKEHHIIIIINKNQKGKISIEFPQYPHLFETINKISLLVSQQC